MLLKIFKIFLDRLLRTIREFCTYVLPNRNRNMKIRNKKTGEITSAIYGPHRNKMCYHVEQANGSMKPFSDKNFDKTFQIIEK